MAVNPRRKLLSFDDNSSIRFFSEFGGWSPGCWIVQAHPTEACAGGFGGWFQSPMIDLSEVMVSARLEVPGETEPSSAEVQLGKGYPGRW